VWGCHKAAAQDGYPLPPPATEPWIETPDGKLTAEEDHQADVRGDEPNRLLTPAPPSLERAVVSETMEEYQKAMEFLDDDAPLNGGWLKACKDLDDHRQKAEPVKVETPRCEPPEGTKYGQTYHWVQIQARRHSTGTILLDGYRRWCLDAFRRLAYRSKPLLRSAIKYLGPCEIYRHLPLPFPSSARVEWG